MRIKFERDVPNETLWSIAAFLVLCPVILAIGASIEEARRQERASRDKAIYEVFLCGESSLVTDGRTEACPGKDYDCMVMLGDVQTPGRCHSTRRRFDSYADCVKAARVAGMSQFASTALPACFKIVTSRGE